MAGAHATPGVSEPMSTLWGRRRHSCRTVWSRHRTPKKTTTRTREQMNKGQCCLGCWAPSRKGAPQSCRAHAPHRARPNPMSTLWGRRRHSCRTVWSLRLDEKERQGLQSCRVVTHTHPLFVASVAHTRCNQRRSDHAGTRCLLGTLIRFGPVGKPNGY